MAIKRGRESEEADSLATAQYLMLLSNSLDNYKPTEHLMMTMKSTGVFECKTCGRKFPSFQALGGHRASHKRAKIMGDKPYDRDDNKFLSLATKPKMHECSICGQEFSMGQALGGHMRRHKLEMTEKSFAGTVPLDLPKLPVLRRSNSSRRVFGLDLNLTPLENDLEYLFGNKAPKVGNLI